MGVNSLPKTVTRQRRDSELNPGPSVPANHSATEPPVMDIPTTKNMSKFFTNLLIYRLT